MFWRELLFMRFWMKFYWISSSSESNHLLLTYCLLICAVCDTVYGLYRIDMDRPPEPAGRITPYKSFDRVSVLISHTIPNIFYNFVFFLKLSDHCSPPFYWRFVKWCKNCCLILSKGGHQICKKWESEISFVSNMVPIRSRFLIILFPSKVSYEQLLSPQTEINGSQSLIFNSVVIGRWKFVNIVEKRY